MEKNTSSLPKTSGLASAWRRLRRKIDSQSVINDWPYICIPSNNIKALPGPTAFRENLLQLIDNAQRRILLATLYLQDDDGGQEILLALHDAKKRRPELEISVFVDWHRAQRGLIGKAKSPGNVALYQKVAKELGLGVQIYGIPVQRREFFGVMHLKGFVIDDDVLYSGASLNDVYLQYFPRYRIDRYHLIHSAVLANIMVELMTNTLQHHLAVNRLDTDKIPKTVTIRRQIAHLRQELTKARYTLPEKLTQRPLNSDEVGVLPLIGLGVRENAVNRAILDLIREAKKHVVLFTPYFNLPGPIYRMIDAALKKGCKVTIITADKTANDFYISPEETFQTIGALPYLYEVNLRRFCKKYHKAIGSNLLNIHLWQHHDNTFHLKGLLVDDDYTLLTGHNFNPRAWRLDLENSLLIRDPHKLLLNQNHAELESILVHSRRLMHYSELEDIKDYPQPVRRLMRRLTRVRADRLINQVL